MLYVFLGDRKEARQKLGEIRSLLVSKRPEAQVFRVDTEAFPEHDLAGLAESQGLFEEKSIIELDSLFTEGEADESFIPLLSESDNAFLVIEGKPLKKLRTLFEKHAETVFDFSKEKTKAKEFSAFSLADALGNRDKKKLWVLYREAVSRGYALEEIHGILFWQVKMISLAEKTQSAAEAGVKQFPYSKAKQFAKRFEEGEADALLHSLTESLLESRGKNIPLEHTLERAILSV